MPLTGHLLAWLTIAVTLAALVAVVVWWPALAGRRPTSVLARSAALLGVNLLVLLTASVQLNNQFLFFAGWSDLAGAIKGTPATSRLHGGGTALGAARAPVVGDGSVTAAGPLQPLPAGSRVADGVTAYTVTGPLSRLTGQILVTPPPGYSAAGPAGEPDRRYPVIETFSGYPSSPAQWVKTMHLRTDLAGAVTAGRIGQAFIVSPQVEIPAGIDTECVNGRPGSPQVETWLAQDVPNWVAAHFAVRLDRGSWATMGLSSGGWCAAMVAMLHPAQFGGAVVLGGYFRPTFAPADEPFPATDPLARRYDLVALAKAAPPPVALWVETSHADPVSYGTTTALLKAAHAPLSITATVLQDAGHRIGVWRALMPNALGWLGASLPGFSPSG